jgi:hypothetical protein
MSSSFIAKPYREATGEIKKLKRCCVNINDGCRRFGRGYNFQID